MCRTRRALTTTGVALLVALRCAAAGAESAPAKPPTAGEAADAALRPPDGRWLRDDEGRQYFVKQLPLPPQAYTWLNPEKTRARLPHGLEMDVVAHDEQSISVKIYRADDAGPSVGPRPPTAEQRARVAASYRVDVKRGPALRLVGFDDGLPTRGQWRDGFAVADMDGDGHLDIVFGPARKSRRPPVVFRGDGKGHWTVWREARFPDMPFDYGDAAVADLNGDGRLDVVLASHLRGIIATIGDGHGGFSAWTSGIEFALPGGKDQPAFSSRAIAIADWNRDGRPDVIALGEGPMFAVGPSAASAARQGSRGAVVYLNGGDGTWKKVAHPGSGSFGTSLAVADFNGDGILDFVAGSDRRGNRALLNLGDADGSWKETEIPALPPEGIFQAVATADFDRDGHPDIAVTFLTEELGVERSGIAVLLWRGGAWERKNLVVSESGPAIESLATGDVDGDGAPDLVGVDERGELLVFRGDGHGGFSRQSVSAPAHEACRGYGLVLTDLDGKRGDEIVVSSADEQQMNPLGPPSSCPGQGSIRVLRVSHD